MVHFDLKSPEFLLFLSIFCRNFPKIEHIFYFIRFRSCCNLLNNWFISFFDLTNFLFFWSKLCFFFQTFDKKILENELQNWPTIVSQKRTQKWEKIEQNWPQKLKSQFGPDRNYESSCWGGKHFTKVAQPDYPIWLGAKFFQK